MNINHGASLTTKKAEIVSEIQQNSLEAILNIMPYYTQINDVVRMAQLALKMINNGKNSLTISEKQELVDIQARIDQITTIRTTVNTKLNVVNASSNPNAIYNAAKDVKNLKGG